MISIAIVTCMGDQGYIDGKGEENEDIIVPG
jgi:hypothetical protein